MKDLPRNWYLLHKDSSFLDVPSTSFDELRPVRVIYHTPIIIPPSSGFISKPTPDALSRISSINRLNDRIRRRLEIADQFNQQIPIPSIITEEADDSLISAPTAFSESSRKNAAQFVDEHFHFIKDETDSGRIVFLNCFFILGVGKDSRDSQIVPRKTSSGSDTAYKEKDKKIIISRYYDQRSLSDPIENGYKNRNLKKTDSLDSDSIKLEVRNKKKLHPSRRSFKDRRDYIQFGQPSGRRKKASFLRRDSYFYQKCDVCLNDPRSGSICPACGTIGTMPSTAKVSQLTRMFERKASQLSRRPPIKRPSRYPPPIPPIVPLAQPPLPSNVTIEPYVSSSLDHREIAGWNRQKPTKPYYPNVNPKKISPQILNIDSLGRYQLYRSYAPSFRAHQKGPYLNGYMTAPPRNTNRISPIVSKQSTIIWPANAGPAWKLRDTFPLNRNISSPPSPVFRYGPKNLPRWLYDYDAYAEEQRQKALERRKRQILAIVFCLLALALVVAAGVVLAALH